MTFLMRGFVFLHIVTLVFLLLEDNLLWWPVAGKVISRGRQNTVV